MDFDIVDLDSITEDALIATISGNIRKSRLMASEIENLKKHSLSCEQSDSEEDSVFVGAETDDDPSFDDELDDCFEDEVDYYYQLLKSYKIDELEENIGKILPSSQKYNYRRILYRMKAEVLKNIKQIKDFISSEDVSLEEAEMFKDELLLERKRLELLDRYLSMESDVYLEPTENKLVFFPTPNGNIHVFDSLESLDESYLERFYDLFMSIKNGTFKGVKRFNNHSALNGLCEVKAPLARVVYGRLSSDIYVIISAFIKKNVCDQGYKNFLVKHCRDYKNIERLLRESIGNEEFMGLSAEYEEELFRLLSGSLEKEDSTVKEKRSKAYGKYFKTN